MALVAFGALVVIHAGLAAVWLGGMAYSLTVVQPKVARFFATDDGRHEEFVALIARGNRRATRLRRQLRTLAWTMTALIGAAFVIGISVSVAAR